MTQLTVVTRMDAPPQRCFDLTRSVETHLQSSTQTGERAVGGKTTGLLQLGDEITFEGRHFGIRQRFTSRITAMNCPTHFRDEMIRGAFKSFMHDHYFEPSGNGTRMVDVLQYAAPYGLLGWVVEKAVLNSYLRRFLRRRGQVLKDLAERSPPITRREN